MSKINYTYTNFGNDTARAYGQSLGISTKASINICKAIRGLPAAKAVQYLEDVIAFRRAIPYTRFTDGVGHRSGAMAAGRYPIKACAAILVIVKSAIANAANKGLADELVLAHSSAQRAATQFHQGRQRRRMMKRSHIEIVVKEVELKKATPKSTSTKSATPKVAKEEEKPIASSKPEPQKVAAEADVDETPKSKEAQK